MTLHEIFLSIFDNSILASRIKLRMLSELSISRKIIFSASSTFAGCLSICNIAERIMFTLWWATRFVFTTYSGLQFVSLSRSMILWLSDKRLLMRVALFSLLY